MLQYNSFQAETPLTILSRMQSDMPNLKATADFLRLEPQQDLAKNNDETCAICRLRYKPKLIDSNIDSHKYGTAERDLQYVVDALTQESWNIDPKKKGGKSNSTSDQKKKTVSCKRTPTFSELQQMLNTSVAYCSERPVSLSCGHIFGVRCILKYMKAAPDQGRILCPYCRQRIMRISGPCKKYEAIFDRFNRQAFSELSTANVWREGNKLLPDFCRSQGERLDETIIRNLWDYWLLSRQPRSIRRKLLEAVKSPGFARLISPGAPAKIQLPLDPKAVLDHTATKHNIFEGDAEQKMLFIQFTKLVIGRVVSAA